MFGRLRRVYQRYGNRQTAKIAGGAISAGAAAKRYGPRVRVPRMRFPSMPSWGGTSAASGQSRGRRAADVVEKKFHDYAIAEATCATTWSIYSSLNLIAQGTTESTRVGRKITITDLHMRFICKLNEQEQDVVPSTINARVVVFVDKQKNGGTVAALDLFAENSWDSFNNLSNKGRFTVLMDRKMKFQPRAMVYFNNSQDSTGDPRYFEFHKSMSLPIEFDGSSGVESEIKSNNLAFAIVADANSLCTVKTQVRVRFLDQ